MRALRGETPTPPARGPGAAPSFRRLVCGRAQSPHASWTLRTAHPAALGAYSSSATARLAPYSCLSHQSFGFPPCGARCAWAGAPRRGNDDILRHAGAADARTVHVGRTTVTRCHIPNSRCDYLSMSLLLRRYELASARLCPVGSCGPVGCRRDRPTTRCVRETLTVCARSGVQGAVLPTLQRSRGLTRMLWPRRRRHLATAPALGEAAAAAGCGPPRASLERRGSVRTLPWRGCPARGGSRPLRDGGPMRPCTQPRARTHRCRSAQRPIRAVATEQRLCGAR